MLRTRLRRNLGLVLERLAGPLRLYQWIEERELGLIAAGVAFFGFLAIFPALAALIALWGFAADPHAIREQMVLAEDFVPPEAFKLLSGQIEALLAVNNRQLGWATILSTLFALWSARAGVAALIRGINAIHGLPGRDGLWHQVQAAGLTLALIGLAIAATVLAIGAPLVVGFLPLGPGEVMALEAANLALGGLLVAAGIGLIYWMAPNHPDGSHPRLFTWGLLLAVVLWAAVSRGFVWYLANFDSYNRVYGSIGAVAALMMWMYLAAYAILLGAALDAERSAKRSSNPAPGTSPVLPRPPN